MTIRAAVYARYSTDKQSDASIEDQLRVCERLAERHGFQVVARFHDAAISGGTAARPGYQQMLTAARSKPRPFDVIVAEDVSRLWRLLSEQAPRLAELADLQVRVVTHDLDTSQESAAILGAVNGAMAEAYRREISRRTRRGLEGRAIAGKPAGGRAYGYIPAAQSGTGQIEIEPAQAAVVVRIFTMYADGKSPRSIAEQLNAEAIPSPGSHWNRTGRRRSGWLASAIWGDPTKGVGILNNSLYTGQVVWGRERWLRSAADSSRRRRVAVDSEQWIIHQVERLRIVSNDLWERVKVRQRARSAGIGAAVVGGLERAKAKRGRPNRYVLSGLLRCPDCGSGYTVTAHKLYACASYTNGGPSACGNSAKFHREEAEAGLLAGLRERMLQPDAVAHVRQRVVELLRAQAEPPAADVQQQVAALERERENLVAAIAAGVLSDAVRQRLNATEAALKRLLADHEPAPVRKVERLLPRIIDNYRQLVSRLEQRSASQDADRARAELRNLLGPVVARPDGAVVRLEFQEEQADWAFVRTCGGRGAPTDVNLVAGAGFEPATFGL